MGPIKGHCEFLQGRINFLIPICRLIIFAIGFCLRKGILNGGINKTATIFKRNIKTLCNTVISICCYLIITE